MMQAVASPTDFDQWRSVALTLLRQNVRPEDVIWSDKDQPSLFEVPSHDVKDDSPIRISASARELLTTIALHRSNERWVIAYRLLYRIVIEKKRDLLNNLADPDVWRARRMEEEIQKDLHRFHAFLRFRVFQDFEGERYVAWYRPDHRILSRAAPFFVNRFATMRWSIFTPDGSAHWDGQNLIIDDSPYPADVQDPDVEDLWRCYYHSAFNPARTNELLLRQHVPDRFRPHMPEMQPVRTLLNSAPAELEKMTSVVRPSPIAEPVSNLAQVSEAIQHCTSCPIGLNGTQAVPGEGPGRAPVMVVGEQPGDEEERTGQPFVGPAGAVLNEIFAQMGQSRQNLYVTNAVKHFKFTPRGKIRIHQKPDGKEIGICRIWLEEEIRLIQPKTIVCLGASAALGVLGMQVPIGKNLRKVFSHPSGASVYVTYHPAAVLRSQDAQFSTLMKNEIAWTLNHALQPSGS